MKRLWWLLLFSGCCVSTCPADIYHIDAVEMIDGKKVDGNGTAVCVASVEGRSVLLTAKHVVLNSQNNTWVAVDGRWVLAHDIRLHPTADLATLEVDVKLSATPIGEDPRAGDAVTVAGFGPALHKQSDGTTFTGTIESVDDDETYTLFGSDGNHVIPGDSGGAVMCGNTVVGIASWHDGKPEDSRSRRTVMSRSRIRTGFVGCRTITRFVETQYGRCGPGGCPIQIRPHVQQPFFGPFPVGPPRVIGIAEPVPQQYVPVPNPQYDVQPAPRPQPQPQVEYIQGPPGPRGPAGAPGQRGESGTSVTQEQVEAVVNAWLDSNREALRGEPGPAGPNGNSANTEAIESRLAELERRPFRIIISSDGKVVDDETYAPGEPVVLDLKRLRSVSGGR